MLSVLCVPALQNASGIIISNKKKFLQFTVRNKNGLVIKNY